MKPKYYSDRKDALAAAARGEPLSVNADDVPELVDLPTVVDARLWQATTAGLTHLAQLRHLQKVSLREVALPEGMTWPPENPTMAPVLAAPSVARLLLGGLAR